MTETMFMPLNLRYTRNHLWLREVGRQDLYVGITDYAQKELGRIDFIEMQRKGSKKNKGESFGTIYGANKCVELIMPFEGQLLLVNPDVVKHPGELNTDPYHSWIALLTAAICVTEFMSKYLMPGDYKYAITATKI